VRLIYTDQNKSVKKEVVKKRKASRTLDFHFPVCTLAILCIGARTHAPFVWLISHQPVVLFSQNKPAISKQPAVLFSHNKSAPAISHQPNEQAEAWLLSLLVRFSACSVGWWLMAGAGLLREKSTAGWLLVCSERKVLPVVADTTVQAKGV
jgi:hypothetical protein